MNERFPLIDPRISVKPPQVRKENLFSEQNNRTVRKWTTLKPWEYSCKIWYLFLFLLGPINFTWIWLTRGREKLGCLPLFRNNRKTTPLFLSFCARNAQLFCDVTKYFSSLAVSISHLVVNQRECHCCSSHATRSCQEYAACTRQGTTGNGWPRYGVYTSAFWSASICCTAEKYWQKL